jgi:AmmeMemoRadiSam system protein B
LHIPRILLYSNQDKSKEREMQVRKPSAAQFYPGDCRAQIEAFKKGFKPPETPNKVVAGIVPHAGWFFSGATAAKVFLTIKARQAPRTFILLGSVHMPGVWKNSVYASGSWETPLGQVSVDEQMARHLIENMQDLLVSDPTAHKDEHSIEVQTAMIKYLFPDSKIVPIAVPPGKDAVRLGYGIGRLVKEGGLDAVVVGTSDLTHYGDNYGFSPAGYGRPGYEWMLQNDRRVIDLAITLRPEEILPEAVAHRNACGAGAMAGTVAAAKEMGAGIGHLLEHTTSYDVYPQGEFNMAVGYAAIVF